MEPAKESIIYITHVEKTYYNDSTNEVELKFHEIPAKFYINQTTLKHGDRVRITITKEPANANPQD